MGPRLSFAVAFIFILGACGENSKTPVGGNGDPSRGRQVYLAQCTACHNSDPAKDGPLGPAIKGSSRELLEARLLRGAYPSGYTPKRNTSVMKPMPPLEASIPDLAAFLR
ncbi:MAG: cytochrome c [candidate division NC10 bacterium]|nr:cytochrome c [candidate division NC10 bacterium]